MWVCGCVCAGGCGVGVELVVFSFTVCKIHIFYPFLY